MRITDFVFFIWKYLTDSRFRRDVKSLRFASRGYIYFAYKILEEISVLEYLKEWHSISEILKEKGIDSKYSGMVEEMLDILVPSGYVEYKERKYRYTGKTMKFPEKEYEFLTKYCPYSTRWTFKLVNEAKNSLLGIDDDSEKLGFDSRKSVEIWDGMMNEAPVSFRKIALELAVKQMKDESYFLYLGCGTGNGILQLFDICKKYKKRIKIFAVDKSRISLEILKQKLQTTSSIDLVLSDITKLPFKTKFDCVFMSLSYHYIPAESRIEFLRQVRELLRPNGLFVNYQILHYGKFKRSPIWVMNLVPGYEGYPYYDEYIGQLREVFRIVKEYLKGIVVVCRP